MVMSNFQIAAAQVPSVRNDIQRNLAEHEAAMKVAAAHRISVLVFPELSLTGYEPDLASELAIEKSDPRLKIFQSFAEQYQMQIVVGAPLQLGVEKPGLGAIVFGSDGTRQTYCKVHLGASERAFFTAGDSSLMLASGEQKIGLAICADSSQPSHPAACADAGANIYAAGVFLNEEWYRTDVPRLADYASRFRMLVVMANHGESIGTYKSVGQTAIWGPNGQVLVQCANAKAALVIATHAKSGWTGQIVNI